MFRFFLCILLMVSAVGCGGMAVRTRVAFESPVETRVTAELTPVNPNAGRVRAINVQPGVGSGRVAVVDVDGLLLNTPFVGPMSVGENPVALFREKLDAIEADPCIEAVVLRVNSPGGGVAACIAMRHDLERFKARVGIPVVACLMDTAAGGAYYLASAADTVIAGPATVTGGIGVLLNLFNLQDLMALYNVRPQLIKSGDLIDIGTSARALQPEERKLLEAMATEFHQQIQAEIQRSRPKVNPNEGQTFDGRIFTGKHAVAVGLADRIGDLDDAIQLAGQMGCGLTTELPPVVLYRRTNDPANSVYSITANIPLQGAGLLPNLPGLDRAKLPTFLSVWEPELTIEKLGGK
jgi:protease-4